MDLRHLAAAQAGVFSRGQALGHGCTSNTIDRRLASGKWRRVGPHAGVYAEAATTISWDSRVWAAVLGVGEPCAVGAGTAATVWGWADRRPTVIDLVVPPGRRLSRQPGIRVRRLNVNARDVTRRDGLPITTRTRTLADCLRFLPLADAVTTLDRAQQLHRLDLTRVAQHLPARGPGTRQARQLLAAARGEHSSAERLATSLLRAARIVGWRTNYRLVLDGRAVVVDIAFPALRVAIEIDGWAFHTDVDAFQRDRTRQNLLVRHGWRVLRFTYRDLVERPDLVVAEVLAAVRGTGQRHAG